MLVNLSVKDFLAKTAGNDPVPGGGSIAALNAAIAWSPCRHCIQLKIESVLKKLGFDLRS